MVKLGDQEPFTSSYTVTNACVEVGSDAVDAVQVTDSKFNHSETGRAAKPVMSVGPAAFTALVDFARSTV
jgi:hypothetical protein